MNLVSCRFCGAEILFIPDVKAMSKANKDHAHLKPQPKGHIGVSPADIEADLVRQELEGLTVEA